MLYNYISGFIMATEYILVILISVRCLLSFMYMDDNPRMRKNNVFLSFTYDTTEPILKPFRELLPRGTMFDVSPIVALSVIQLTFYAIFIVLKLFLKA